MIFDLCISATEDKLRLGVGIDELVPRKTTFIHDFFYNYFSDFDFEPNRFSVPLINRLMLLRCVNTIKPAAKKEKTNKESGTSLYRPNRKIARTKGSVIAAHIEPRET